MVFREVFASLLAVFGVEVIGPVWDGSFGSSSSENRLDLTDCPNGSFIWPYLAFELLGSLREASRSAGTFINLYSFSVPSAVRRMAM
jgi:hypothetical protein